METRWTLRLICKKKKKRTIQCKRYRTRHTQRKYTQRERKISSSKNKNPYTHRGRRKKCPEISSNDTRERQYNHLFLVADILFLCLDEFSFVMLFNRDKDIDGNIVNVNNRRDRETKKNEQESVHLKYFTPHIHSSHRDAPYELKHWK